MDRTSYTIELTKPQQAVLADILRTGNYQPLTVEHAIVAAATPDCRIAIYRSGKCLVQGAGATDFVTFVLEPLVLKAVGLGYEDVLDPDASRPHIGVDESGKGDFWGPLVVAGAYVDGALVATMREMNVRDSKRISSDTVALDMARDLRRLLGQRYSLVTIGPAAYNRLYSRLRNVNTILSWAHARAIENLLEKVPDCPRAVSDQFGSKEQVRRALMKRGREIELVQRHRAESDPAVAAASILARAAFLYALRKLEEQHKVPFPKGASAAVVESGRKLVEAKGGKILMETAKCHFKTTDAILAQLKMDRSVLGPEGAATSKPSAYHRRS
jgi:ribonuclease HIII